MNGQLEEFWGRLGLFEFEQHLFPGHVFSWQNFGTTKNTSRSTTCSGLHLKLRVIIRKKMEGVTSRIYLPETNISLKNWCSEDDLLCGGQPVSFWVWTVHSLFYNAQRNAIAEVVVFCLLAVHLLHPSHAKFPPKKKICLLGCWKKWQTYSCPNGGFSWWWIPWHWKKL